MDSLLILKKWFPGMDNAPDEELDMYGGRILKLLLHREIDDSKDDWKTQQIWANIKKDVLATHDSYEERKKYGEEHGRKMDPASILTWQYCQDHPQANANEVGEFLLSQGIDKRSPATNKKGPYSKIYDLDGWKQRKNSEWEFGKSSESFIGIQNQNSDEIERNSDGTPNF